MARIRRTAIEAIRAKVDEPEFESAWAAGRALPEHQVLDEAERALVG